MADLGRGVTVLPAKLEDVWELARNMRDQDREELHASSGEDIVHILRESYKYSDWTMAGRVNGELACLFGVRGSTTMICNFGVPWMLGTPVLEKHPGALMRHCAGYVALMAERYPLLMNWVDARNTRSIRWLKRLGFEVHPAVPHGKARLPFHKFERHREGRQCANQQQ